MSRLTVDQLRRLIAEEVKKNLVEVGEKDKKEEGEDSLDDQVDRYLADYEAESKASKNEGKDFRALVRRFLSEAEEDKKDEKEPKKLTAEDLDVESFVNNVMRLVDNYDSLLEVRNTILRRAVNFLVEGYTPDVAMAFKENLLDLHGIEIGKSKAETEDEKYEVPPADRAGPSLGG